ncbi:MAG TPA: VOC family protein [Candidatus Polarisedimenticolia bacterium]|nr:VOC family protein [Candidatus Polarisedimenticolia bacterium]
MTKPKGPLALVPMAYVRSVQDSIAFYRRFGFEVGNTNTLPGETEPNWAWLQSHRAQLMLARATSPVVASDQAVLFYVYVADVEAFRAGLLEAGMEAGPIRQPFYAPRGEFRVTDPDGYVVMVTHAG